MAIKTYPVDIAGKTGPRASTLAKIANALGYRLTLVKQQVGDAASV
jgi:hypothetical protein